MKWKFFSLHRSRRVLRQVYRLYRRKAKTLSSVQQEELQDLLKRLQAAILEKNAEAAICIAKILEESSRRLITKSRWDQLRDFCSGLIFALIVAIAIRQMWFELYRIPSGSMRPTLKEADFLLVSKTDFGINTLTRTSHLFFDPDLIQRGQIVIFSVENMDVADPDTMYFYLIPGKKQFVKRLIGKPGDTLYFYGGRIYGMDMDGRDLIELRSTSWVEPLEHIPFIRFDGKPQTPAIPIKGIFSPVQFNQMNEPIASLTMQDYGKMTGEMLVPMKNYYDVWGFKNFAMARLLTPAQLKQLHSTESNDLVKAPLYLELTHHPSLIHATLTRDEYRRLRPDLATSVSIIPLDSEKIDEVMRHMVTCRFCVKDGRAARYGSSFASTFLPRMQGIENGMYEIQNGQAYRVMMGGITLRLPDDHPLLSRDPQHVQMLYNLGIEMDTHFTPAHPSGLFFPSRYAYFRNHDLYLMGAPIFKESDPALAEFLTRENNQVKSNPGYAPFDDMGPPLAPDGQLDKDFIRQFGLKVPDGMYLVLGDNHAMSGDSRQFGFVPQNNLRGGASFLLWPFGPRWGRLPQPGIAHCTLPNLIIWGLFLLICSITIIYLRKKYNKPLKF
jgi:signal peptidase I